MKRKFKLVFNFFSFSAVLLLMCSCSEKEMQSVGKLIVSRDYKYKIEAPADWEEIKPGDEFAVDNASLQAVCKERGIYYTVYIDENQTDIINLENYSRRMKKRLDRTGLIKIDDFSFEPAVLNGSDIMKYESIIIGEEEESCIWSIIESYKDAYVTFLIVVTKDEYMDEKRDETDLVTSSFGIFEYQGSTD